MMTWRTKGLGVKEMHGEEKQNGWKREIGNKQTTKNTTLKTKFVG